MGLYPHLGLTQEPQESCKWCNLCCSLVKVYQINLPLEGNPWCKFDAIQIATQPYQSRICVPRTSVHNRTESLFGFSVSMLLGHPIWLIITNKPEKACLIMCALGEIHTADNTGPWKPCIRQIDKMVQVQLIPSEQHNQARKTYFWWLGYTISTHGLSCRLHNTGLIQARTWEWSCAPHSW